MPQAALNQSHSKTAPGEQLQLLWWFGNWQSIADLTGDSQKRDENALIMQIYRAAALYQLGCTEEARTLLTGMSLTPDTKIVLAQLLISGVYNCLGKASSCIIGDDRTDSFFLSAIGAVSDTDVLPQLVSARKAEQLAQLGIPSLWPKQTGAAFKPDIEEVLHQLLKFDSENPYLHIGLGEAAISGANFQSAIVHWQAVAAGLGINTPQMYYDRLKFAYDKAGRYPLASDEEEVLRGDKDKHELLLEIQRSLKPSFYLEIGVESGKSLSFAKCQAVGVDPMPRVTHKLGENTNVVVSTSDDFFSKQIKNYLASSIDLAFIDGMHLFEFALRDFINVEKFCTEHALIIIDDIYPGHKAQADRDRRTRAWTGDVWKLHAILTRYRPDLFIATLDVYPTGLMLIAGLDNNSKVLDDKYEEAVQWLKDKSIPSDYITRDGAWSGKDIRISKLVSAITEAKFSGINAKELVVILNELNGMTESKP